jgi:cell wall-associated NlpC family hydrolase
MINKLFISINIVALFVACTMQPDPRYTNEDIPRKENPNWIRKENTNSDTLVSSLPENQVNTDVFPVQSETFKKFKSEIKKYWKSPYVWGGASPAGTDCSGLIQSIYRDVYQMKIPHSTRKLFTLGEPVQSQNLQFGDLVFFRFKNRNRSFPDHVGLYIMDSFFIHASSTNGVTLSKLNQSPYSKIYVGARRLLD